MQTLKTKVLCIFTAVFLLVSAMPTTALATDVVSAPIDEHIYSHHNCSAETTEPLATPSASRGLTCLLGIHALVTRTETIETGGFGYDYCNSYTVYEITHCLECGYSKMTEGTKTTVPHDWSVGWCGQTCKTCNIVEMFHEDGGCWYCS